MRHFLSHQAKKQASSLVVTLLVIVVLSTIVVAFMQSMSVERKTAKSFANQYRAELVSDAAIQAALHDLSAVTTSGPYSTIFSIEPGKASPYLFQAQLTNQGSVVALQRYPQFTTLQSLSAFTNASVQIIQTNTYSVADFANGSAVSRSLSSSADVYVNINATNKSFPYGQIGLLSGTNPLSIPVNWIYFRDKDGTVIGRYAYWVDDECSKIDLRYAGNSAGAVGTHLRGNGTNANEVSLLSLTNTGLNSAFITNLFFYKANATNRLATSEARYGTTNIPDGNWQLLRGYLTQFSLHDDRAPDGRRKLNLNSVVSATNSQVEILAQVSKIRDAIHTNIPTFGMRYYQASPPTADHQTNYLNKIAANIRDFIDSDRNATVVLESGTASTTNSPNFVPYNLISADEYPVFGKEDVPFLNEYVRVMRVISPSSTADTAPDSTLRTLIVRAAHYIELWNLGPKDISYIDLGSNPFVCVANRTSWVNNAGSGTPSTLRPVDIRIYLPTNFVVPAGGYAVLTTDGPPWNDSQSDYLGSSTNRYTVTRLSGDTAVLDSPQPGTWQAVDAGGQTIPSGSAYEDYAGLSTTRKTTSGDSRYLFQCYGSGSPSYADCRERLLFGDDNGLFDCTLRTFTVATTYLGFAAKNPQYACTYIADGSSSVANNGGSTSRFSRGDPRTSIESMSLTGNTGSAWKSAGSTYGDSFASLQQTLGALNFNVDPSLAPIRYCGWNEYTTDLGANHLIPNTKLYSLGQLGFVYDPARYDINSFRGSGRTLRIGQSDDPANNRNANSTASLDMNWLGGLGSTNHTTTNSFNNAFKLLNVFRIDDTNFGRINPNGIARGSNNSAINSVLHNFTFTTNLTEGSSTILSGRVLASTNLMSAMLTNVSSNLPFVGVGDLSNLGIFNTGTNLAGVDMTIVSDAGKEEFLRRTANLMTTESLAFNIIVKAQAGSFRGDKFYPYSTVTRETTVQFIPTYPGNQDRPLPDSWQIKAVKDMFY